MPDRFALICPCPLSRQWAKNVSQAILLKQAHLHTDAKVKLAFVTLVSNNVGFWHHHFWGQTPREKSGETCFFSPVLKHSDRLAWVVLAGEWGDWSRPGTLDVNGQSGELSNLACPPPRQIWPGKSEPGNIRKAAKAWKRKRGIFLDVMHAPGEIESLVLVPPNEIANIATILNKIWTYSVRLSPDLVQDWFKRYHWWNPTQTWPGGQFEVWRPSALKLSRLVKSFKLHDCCMCCPCWSCVEEGFGSKWSAVGRSTLKLLQHQRPHMTTWLVWGWTGLTMIWRTTSLAGFLNASTERDTSHKDVTHTLSEFEKWYSQPAILGRGQDASGGFLACKHSGAPIQSVSNVPQMFYNLYRKLWGHFCPGKLQKPRFE